MSDDEQRKLAAIMFTDMVGYSALSQRDSKLAMELLEEHRALLREIFPRFNGTEIKTIGDGFLVEFSSALEAAQCAIAIQRALAKRDADAPAERQIQVRIGQTRVMDFARGGGRFRKSLGCHISQIILHSADRLSSADCGELIFPHLQRLWKCDVAGLA